MENHNNLPAVRTNNLPAKLKKNILKFGRVLGSGIAFGASVAAIGTSIVLFPPLAIPARSISRLYRSKIS